MFYKELQEKRKELGLSLEQISQKIKINQDILENIEKGEFSSVPDLYIRLFIKSYAFELGLVPEEYLQKYEEEFGSKKHDVKQDIIQNNENISITDSSPVNSISDRSKLIAFVSIVAVLIFVIVILKQILSENEQPTVSPIHQRLMESDSSDQTAEISDINKSDESQTNTETTDNQQDSEPVSPTAETNNNEIQTTETQLDSANMFDLKMEINDTCWVKIIIDEKDTSEAIFRPGTTREWQAFKIFDLRVGRPEVVNIYINDVEIDSIDTSKAPARMMISEQGIINR